MFSESEKSFLPKSCRVHAILLVACMGLAVQPMTAQAPRLITPAMEQKIDAMMNKLTLTQKIILLGGEDGLYLRGEPTIGLPRMKMSDGPLGVRTWGTVDGVCRQHQPRGELG